MKNPKRLSKKIPSKNVHNFSTSDGEKLHKYIRDNKINIETLATKMGYSGRHGLVHYFHKERLSVEFKHKLAEAGIDIFKVGNPTDPNAGLKDALIASLEENKLHLEEAIQRLRKEDEAQKRTIAELQQELKQLRLKALHRK